MTTMNKIKLTISSYNGRKKMLEEDDNVSLDEYLKACDQLDIACLNSIKTIIEVDEKANRGS